jgi:hypothetical protein
MDARQGLNKYFDGPSVDANAYSFFAVVGRGKKNCAAGSTDYDDITETFLQLSETAFDHDSRININTRRHTNAIVRHHEHMPRRCSVSVY